MAFVGIFLTNLIFFIIVLSILFIIGIGLLIFGFIKKKKDKTKGKNIYKLFIGLGLVMLLIPVGTVSYIVIGNVTSIITSQIGAEQSYDNIVDKWKNKEYVLEYEPEDDVLETFFNGVNKKSKSTIKAMFSDKMKNDSLFEENINEIFNSYPEYLTIDNIISNTSGGKTIGDDYREFHKTWKLEKDNRVFYLYINACYFNKNDDSTIGVNSMDFYEMRFINGTWKKFENINRNITEQEVKNTLEKIKSLSEFKKIYGEPNIMEEVNAFYYRLYYELSSDEKNFYYVMIDVTDGFISNEIVKEKIVAYEFIKEEFLSIPN